MAHSKGSSSSRSEKARLAKEAKLEQQRKKRESRGVVCIAFGVLLGVYLFVAAKGALGEFLSHFLFGLFGWVAYVLPILTIVAGCMIIHGSKINNFGRADWMFLLAGWSIAGLFHLSRNSPINGVTLGTYLKEAYETGSKYRLGGGAVGGLLCYPFRQFGGNALAYILLITLLILSALILTRISIKKMGAAVGRGVSSAYQSARASVTRVKEKLPKKKLFIIEEVEVKDTPQEEEFDNPFLPEKERRGKTDLEGFDSLADGFAGRKSEYGYGHDDEDDESGEDFRLFGVDQRNAIILGTSSSPFNPSMETVADLKKKEKERLSSGERPALPASEVKPIGESELPEAKLKRSRYKHVPAPADVAAHVNDDIWSDLDIHQGGTEDEPWPFGDFDETKPGETSSYEVPPFLPHSDPNSAYSPAPVNLRRPGILTEREKFVGPYDSTEEQPDTERDEPKPPVRKRRTSTKKPVEPEAEKPTAEVPSDIVPEAAAPGYVPPPIELLDPASNGMGAADDPEEASKILVNTLQNFNISVRILGYSVGPVITRFELQPAPGVRVSRITGLSNDIALALAAERVRIEAPIPGKSAVGIEVPNKHSQSVVLREIVESAEFKKATSPISLAFGKDIAGKVVTANLEKMPHLLIAGATGSGKSVCINDLILSMVYKSSPDDVRMILIDPKVVELKVYSELPHLLIPVVTDPKKAAGALRWAVNEMMNRYKKFAEIGVRNLQGYNADERIGEDKKMPRLVVIIDELADLMMVAPDDVEDSICRIAQLGRAAAIHLIVATQRPSADIITGLIKANIPSRCAFQVSSGVDSRIILDEMGAEKLLGKGDMLFHPSGAGKPTRVQGAFVSDEEVERIMNYFKGCGNGTPTYDENFVDQVMNAATGGPSGGAFGEGKQEDDLFLDALGVVVENGAASISMIQRRLRVGYARAARLIDMMEQKGYVSGFDGSKPRRLLITKSAYQNLLSGEEPGENGFVSDDTPFEEESVEQ